MEKLRRLQATASALKKNLSMKMEELNNLTESKATALKSEVDTLREEVESLRTLLEVKDQKKAEKGNRSSKPRVPH